MASRRRQVAGAASAPSKSKRPPDLTAQANSTNRAKQPTTMRASFFRNQPVWLILAVASGACAAFNGVFAKLTTTSLTSNWSASLASFLHLANDNKYPEIFLRASFFVLNLAFNGVMWALFTAALTRASSTTRVSIVNVSANFVVTAVLGAAIFSEVLNAWWWVGAALLAVGNVIIGRRDEGENATGVAKTALSRTSGESGEGEERHSLLGENEAEGRESVDLVKLSESIELETGRTSVERRAREEQKRAGEGDAIDAPL